MQGYGLLLNADWTMLTCSGEGDSPSFKEAVVIDFRFPVEKY